MGTAFKSQFCSELQFLHLQIGGSMRLGWGLQNRSQDFISDFLPLTVRQEFLEFSVTIYIKRTMASVPPKGCQPGTVCTRQPCWSCPCFASWTQGVWHGLLAESGMLIATPRPHTHTGGECHGEPGHLLLQLPLCPPTGQPQVGTVLEAQGWVE